MKQIEKNLLTTIIIETDDAKEMLRLRDEEPNSQYSKGREKRAVEKIMVAQGMIKALKMITCSHNTKKGATTGIAWIKDLNNKREVIRSIKEITKRCHYCNQVFYRKRYNLRKKKIERT